MTYVRYVRNHLIPYFVDVCKDAGHEYGEWHGPQLVPDGSGLRNLCLIEWRQCGRCGLIEMREPVSQGVLIRVVMEA